MDTYSPSPATARASAASPWNGGRVPAVIGVEPWSWRGDDNSGNMIHAAAARRLISNYAEFKRPGEWTDADIERVRSEHSHIIFVTANLIRLGVPSDHPSIRTLIESLTPLAKNIERAGLPVVVFGLGSQADLNGASEFTVAPETVHLLRVISGHARKIAVRGAFTAEACYRLGVKNVEVVGCQSMFWHRSPQFSWNLSEALIGGPSKIAFNFTDARSEANLINQAMFKKCDIIGQGNVAEEELKAKEPAAAGSVKFGWDVRFALEKGLIDGRQYEHWIRHHFYQFRQPEPWLDHMRRYCFSYGTRLHGNMAAMIAGTRALWIVHDMRTKELCDHFGLPFVELKEVRGGANLEDLFDRADYSRCAQVYPERYRVLFDYVDGAGLPHSLPAPIGVAGGAECGGRAASR
jgi:Polysaccharide pyruvyl transferase